MKHKCYACKQEKHEDEMDRFTDPYAKAMFGAFEYLWSCKDPKCRTATEERIKKLEQDI